MSRFLITTLILLFLPAQDNFTLTEFVKNYDPVKNITTVLMVPEEISGPKDQYHSLTFAVSYSYPGLTRTAPKAFALDLFSVVKAKTLNPDLYVVFVIDGQEIHFSSDRKAIHNPVPGKPWIGERMTFRIPHEDFNKLASAKKLSVKLGEVSFDFTDANQRTMRLMIDPASILSTPPQTSPHRL